MSSNGEFFASVEGPYQYHVLPPDDEKGHYGVITVYHPDEKRPVANLQVRPKDKQAINGVTFREIHVAVDKNHQRRGIASQMFNIAQEHFGPLRHAPIRSDDAEEWSKAVGGYTPPRVDPNTLQLRGVVRTAK